MKMRSTLIAFGVATMLGGCSTMMDTLTYNDAEVRQLSEGACTEYDKQAKIAPSSSKYTKRLNKIAGQLGNQIDGIPLTYKVYVTKDINAWAMANGCIRVYSGLMDVMNDDELKGVIGHEIGHVALGHSKKRMQMEAATVLARQAAVAFGGSKVAEITASEYGDLAHAVVSGQFSQSNEKEADDYSFDLLISKKQSPVGLVTAFEKLSKLSGGGSGGDIIGNVVGDLVSSHPDAMARADRMRARMTEQKK